jgi:hypothetical protein
MIVPTGLGVLVPRMRGDDKHSAALLCRRYRGDERVNESTKIPLPLRKFTKTHLDHAPWLRYHLFNRLKSPAT